MLLEIPTPMSDVNEICMLCIEASRSCTQIDIPLTDLQLFWVNLAQRTKS